MAFSASMTSSGSPHMCIISSRSSTLTPSSVSMMRRFWSKEPKTLIICSILSTFMVCSIIRVPFAAALFRRVIFFYLRYILTAGGAQRHDRKAAVIPLRD